MSGKGLERMAKERLITMNPKAVLGIGLEGNYRDLNESAVADLMASIREVGVQEPISVVEEGEGYALINGFHRIVATQRLLKEYPHLDISVPAIVLPQDSDLAIKRVIGNSLRHESVLDKARGAATLRAAGKNVKQIAEMLGKERMTIDNWLRLNELFNAAPEEVRKAADLGKDAGLYKVASKFARDNTIDVAAEIRKLLAVKVKAEKITPEKAWQELLLGAGIEKKVATDILAKAKKAKLL